LFRHRPVDACQLHLTSSETTIDDVRRASTLEARADERVAWETSQSDLRDARANGPAPTNWRHVDALLENALEGGCGLIADCFRHRARGGGRLPHSWAAEVMRIPVNTSPTDRPNFFETDPRQLRARSKRRAVSTAEIKPAMDRHHLQKAAEPIDG